MADNNNGADGQILLALKVKESLALMQAQLDQIAKKLNLKITEQLDTAKTRKQLSADLKSFNLNQAIKLAAKLDKTAAKKQFKADLAALDNKASVEVKAELNTEELKRQLKNNNIRIDANVDGAEALNDVGNGLDTINKKSAATVASITLLHEAMNLLEQAARRVIQTAVDLDAQLTDLRMVTGDSYEEAARLVSGYNELAKELGATTTSVLDAASEWLRQGKSIAETTELIEQSMILSKVGAMDSETATKRLTSTMMGYKLAVEEVAGVVDRLTAVDMAAAVSADGIAEALSHTASSAYLAGLELDKIIAYLTVVQETTQKSASVVGESFKSIFARMGKVTNGDAVDDMGEDISKVESTLRSLGIELRKSETEFRNFDEVLDEVGTRWQEFDSVTQRQIATAFGGVYQSENFLSLMNNYEKVAEYVNVAANSAGTAAEKFKAYEESVAAHYNTLIASAEAFAQKSVPTEFINGLLDAGSAILDFMTYTELLKTALAGLSSALAVKGVSAMGKKIKEVTQTVSKLSTAFNLLDKAAKVDLSADEFNSLLAATKGLNAQQLKLIISSKNLTNEQRMQILMASGLTKEQAAQTLATMGLATAEGTATAATFSLSGAFKALTAAIAANPIGFLVVALTTAVSVISTITNKMEEARQETQELAKATIEEKNAELERTAALKEAYAVYKEYSKQTDLTVEEEESLKKAVDDITQSLEDKAIALGHLKQGTEEYTQALEQQIAEELKAQDIAAKEKRNAAEELLLSKSYSSWDGSQITVTVSDSAKAETDAYKLVQEIMGDYIDDGRYYSGAGGMGAYDIEIEPIDWDSSKDVEAVVDYYYKLVELKDALVDNNLMDTDDVYDIYDGVKSVIDDIGADVEAYVQAEYDAVVAAYERAYGIADTVEDFSALRDHVNDELGEKFEFDGLSEQIDRFLIEDNAIYRNYLNNIKATQEMINSIVDGMIPKDYEGLQEGTAAHFHAIDQYGIKVAELKEKLSGLSDEDLTIAYDLLSVPDSSIKSWDELITAMDEYKNGTSDIVSVSNKVRSALETMWASEDFADTKKSIEQMANALDGITADNIDSLIEGSAELAALLEEDGMNAQFLANILQTEVTSGNGFDLITEDALKLNSALDGMKGRFDEVTEAKSRYDAALAGGEKDDNFKNYAEALEALNEEFVKGYENSNQFWAAAEYLFGTEQLNEWGWSQGLDEIYAAMERNVAIFGDAESAGTGFLDRLYEISEAGQITADDGSVIAQIEKLSDGTYDFQFDSTNLDALAERLGITSEAATACMQALSMYGDFQFYDIETVMSTIEEIGLASDSINGTAVNVGTLTDQLIALGYNNKDIFDLMNVLKEVDGVSLIDINANVDTLAQSLSDLGLAAQDGVDINVNADGLSDLMSQLNFTREDTQNLITKLSEADGITLTNAEGEVVSLNDALEYTDGLTFASVTSEIDGITSSAELAEQAVEDLQYSINTLKGKTVTVTLDVQRKSGILGSIFGYAKGTDGAPEGDALVGEEGEELVQSGNRAYFVGTNGAEIVHLNEGDKVYTAAETRKIKRGATVIRGVVPAFAGGTGLGKPDTPTYTSVLPDKPTTTTNSSTTDKAESEFERLYKYHQHLLKMDRESVSDYIAWLDVAYQEAYKNGEIELDDYYKYQEEVFDKIKESLDDLQKTHENAITFDKIKLDNAIEAGDYGDIVKYTDDIVEHYKAMQNEVHLQAEYYRSIGYAETSDEITKLKSLWWDYYEEIKNVSADAWQQVVDNANDALDGVTGLYDTLKGAAQEYAENGYITVDTLQSIYKLGVQNLAYLQDENGQLVINEANIQKVIAARTQQMAIETALSYIQQLRTALTNQDTAALQNLIFATDVAANSTWDLVYAQLQLLGLEDSQYNAALQRINTLRSLADVAVTSIGRIDNSAKEALQNTSDALDDILQYVKDMIKQEVENQVEALEDQIDRYCEIVDLQKKSLDLEREKDNYTKSVTEKTKAIAELQARIARLDLDDSREAQAEKAKLNEELAELNNDLAETQADYAYEVNSDALDAMADAYEDEKRKEIEILEDTISSEEKLYQLAIQRINNEWDTLYQDLINWNYQYGSSTESELVSAWNAASQAVQQYGSYLNAVATTQSQLSAIDNASSSNVIGTMGDYDTSGGATMSRIKEIVAQMKANSIQHGSEDDAGKLRLNKENLRLGEELQGLIGRTVVRGNDGVWYLDKVGGAQLYTTYPYSTYHTGGVVGDQATAEQDELFALLKKGEVVLNEPQQQVLYRVLDSSETLASKLGIGSLYGNMNGSIYAETQSQNAVKRDAQQAQGSVTGTQQNINVQNQIPVQIMVSEKLDKNDIKRLGRIIGEISSKEIYESYRRSGGPRPGNIH